MIGYSIGYREQEARSRWYACSAKIILKLLYILLFFFFFLMLLLF